ncbi:hypothetical protein D3C86_1299370 [compost metagenome]
MTKNKKNWITRFEESDLKAQARLDKENNSGVKTIFQNSKARSRKQSEQEKTLNLTVFVYGFFILEVCMLGGLFLGDSSNSSSLASGLQLLLGLAILSVASVVIGIVALVKRPRVFYIHIPFILNCLLFSLVFIIFAF